MLTCACGGLHSTGASHSATKTKRCFVLAGRRLDTVRACACARVCILPIIVLRWAGPRPVRVTLRGSRFLSCGLCGSRPQWQHRPGLVSTSDRGLIRDNPSVTPCLLLRCVCVFTGVCVCVYWRANARIGRHSRAYVTMPESRESVCVCVYGGPSCPFKMASSTERNRPPSSPSHLHG